ncbi:hypothetical protein B1H19_09920 [Streptomyces gilvosporeus]|uniref:Uncharacterized protein n=1 Tax=Streptomyces gilvosporeus TaxID=553510 RepID=A0A1V0TNT5_9ACTN|nr:hypothetical protein B1H19_09920 [Streptomyces gilvosporeus]
MIVFRQTGAAAGVGIRSCDIARTWRRYLVVAVCVGIGTGVVAQMRVGIGTGTVVEVWLGKGTGTVVQVRDGRGTGAVVEVGW